jgi:hypothetical protein
MRSEGREVSDMKMIVLSNILVWTLWKRFRLGDFLADNLSSGPFIMAFVLNPSGDILWKKQSVMMAIRWYHPCLVLLFLQTCSGGMWAGDVRDSCGRKSRNSGDDWERLGQCPKLLRIDWSVIDTVFPSLFRCYLDQNSVEIPDTTLTHKTVRCNVSHAWFVFWKWLSGLVNYMAKEPWFL